jgi:hypothetical protein
MKLHMPTFEGVKMDKKESFQTNKLYDLSIVVIILGMKNTWFYNNRKWPWIKIIR